MMNKPSSKGDKLLRVGRQPGMEWVRDGKAGYGFGRLVSFGILSDFFVWRWMDWVLSKDIILSRGLFMNLSFLFFSSSSHSILGSKDDVGVTWKVKDFARMSRVGGCCWEI